MTQDSLGDKMKAYERHETDRRFIQSLPIYARIDGRSFSKFTQGLERPYDTRMSSAMIETTKVLVEKTHATIGYVQSDEISLAWIPTEHGHNWFDGKIMKMASVLAGLASSAFMHSISICFDADICQKLLDKMPHFDARVINMPNEEEAARMFLWRNLDATKNAVSMATRHYYSHSDMHLKNQSQMNEMLFAKGINFDSYPYFFKRGTWARRDVETRTLTTEELARIPAPHRPAPDEKFVRGYTKVFDLPPLSRVTNLTDVLFRNCDPINK
jgi:tRNA(His) 5'-end guanylyltransferase